MKIGFIGAGRLGSGLALGLWKKGYNVKAVASRTHASSAALADRIEGCAAMENKQDVIDAADLVFITTPDDMIASTVDELTWQEGKSAVHCCGTFSLDVLDSAARAGAATGSFHPLQSFAGSTLIEDSLEGITYGIEAQGVLLETLRDMAEVLGGKSIVLRREDKALYHVAAVFASNYLIALIGTAVDLLSEIGIPREEALEALLPLAGGTIRNLEQKGLPGSLTGPVARGDLGTVQKHLDVLSVKAPELTTIFKELGKRIIPFASAVGNIDDSTAEKMLKLLR